MTAIQYLGAFRAYGIDVLLIALAVTLLTALFKKTALKNVSKKIFVFLPFVIGTILYAAYRGIAAMSIVPFTSDLAKTLEGGFACGCASTLYYVIYEQFFRAKDERETTSALSPLLEGFIPDEKREEAEQKLLSGCTDKTREELSAFVAETLAPYVDANLPEAETAAFFALVAQYLFTIKK